jgi:hypothetical protein
MSSFTVKNLKELENSAAGRTPELEARFARKQLDSEHLGVSYFHYAPGFRAPMGHSHREQEEACIRGRRRSAGARLVDRLGQRRLFLIALSARRR